MRDPLATLVFSERVVVRQLHRPLPTDHFLRSALAQQWVRDGRLISFEIVDDSTIVSPRLSFVSQPSEWTDGQLLAAARLTLTLQGEAIEAGFDLKDASAWNIVFDGGKPVFCDHLSWVPLTGRTWWPAGQFARHFILPLLASRRRGLRAAHIFRAWRDGLPADVARTLIGPSRYLGRYWPLMTEGASSIPPSEEHSSSVSEYTLTEVLRFRRRLQASLGWMLDGVAPPQGGRASVWSDYVEQRAHYDEPGLIGKRKFIQQALAECQPTRVADLGCNTGEFTRMAADNGAEVVALDADHDSVEHVFAGCTAGGRIHPIFAPLDDLIGGRGWGGSEYPGLDARLAGQLDLVMMLALIHHLIVGAAVPLASVARLAARWSRRWLIVEWVGEGDPQLALLCRQRQRRTDEFTMDTQRRAFADVGFVTVREVELGDGHRVLALLERRG